MRLLICSTVVFFAACAGPMGDPVLEVTLTPNRITDAMPVVVKVAAIDARGLVGTGTVRITSQRGSLVDGIDVPLDSFGTARTEFVCNPVQDLNCFDSVRVVAEWTTGGVTVSAEARLNPSSGGTGGGSGGGGGTLEEGDAGVMILNNPCGTVRKPGSGPTCCYPSGTNNNAAPTCGWTKVEPGFTFAVPFTLEDGGSPNTMAYVNYTLPGPTLDDASQCNPNWALTLMPEGLNGSIAFTWCFRFAVVKPDGLWQLVTNESQRCGPSTASGTAGNVNYWHEDCQDMFANSYQGSIRLLSGARMQVGTERWVQSDGMVYVMPMRPTRP